MARRLPVTATPTGPTPPSKNSLIQAQLDGERAGHAAARNLSSFDLDVDGSDIDKSDVGSVSMCDAVVERAWGQGRSHLYMNPWKDPAPSGPLHEAFRAGFAHAVKERFACVCDPNVDEFDGLRRSRRRNRRR